MNNNSGEYHQITCKNSRLKYWCFIPNNLSVITMQLKVDVELVHLLAKAHRELGILEGMVKSLPEIDSLLNLVYMREAKKSCVIDHIITDFERMLNNSGQTLGDRAAVNYYKALGILEEIPLKVSTICDLHAIVMQNIADNDVGMIRKTTFLMHPQYTSNMAEYNPPPPELLNDLMTDLEKFALEENTIDILIKAAMIYYQFETIHPFESGNGRIGRLLILWFLIHTKVLSKPVLSLSGYLLEYNDDYLGEFIGIQHFSTYTDWVRFFIQGVILSAEETIRRLDLVIKIRNNSIQEIQSFGKSTDRLLLLYRYLEENMIVTVKGVAAALNISYNTAVKSVQILRKLHILQQAGSQSRNRVFVYNKIVEVFV